MLAQEYCDVIDYFFREKHVAGMVRECTSALDIHLLLSEIGQQVSYCLRLKLALCVR